jgi:antitoxin ParD1/3/4
LTNLVVTIIIRVMNVSLTSEMEKWVHGKVGSGLYTSASEVVREAIRTLHEKETRNRTKLASLQDAIQLGIASADQGQLLDWDEKVSKEVKETGRKRRGG